MKSGYKISEKNKKKFNSLFIIIPIFIIIIALLYLFPMGNLLNVTFKTSNEFMINPVSLAKSFNFENYLKVITQKNFFLYFFNSIMYTLVANIVTLIVTSLAAFMISRKYIKYSNFLYILFMAGLFLPDPLLPQFYLIDKIGLYNNPIGYLVLKINPGIVMLLMVGYYKTIPRDFDEAAGIEGCGTFRYILQFLIPLSAPVFATSTILFSIGIWNDIIGTTIFLTSPRYYPIIRALFSFVGQYGTDWPPLAAATILVAAPIIILFLIFQKYIISSAVSTGLKG